MICALLDFEVAYPGGKYDPIDDQVIFKCKMPHLPSDVPDMMGFEVLQAHIGFDRSWYLYEQGAHLFLLDNADNAHNNTLTNELYLSRLDNYAWRWYPDYVNTGEQGISSIRSDEESRPIKYYIKTKQDYLYFRLDSRNGSVSNGFYYIVERAKIIVRLTFDKKQNEYQPKRIML